MKRLDYRIEVLTNDHAIGWVFLRDAPESHVSVDIFLGDKLLGTATANHYREDLARGGIGIGDHGFDFYEIEAFIAEGDDRLLIASIFC